MRGWWQWAAVVPGRAPGWLAAGLLAVWLVAEPVQPSGGVSVGGSPELLGVYGRSYIAGAAAGRCFYCLTVFTLTDCT